MADQPPGDGPPPARPPGAYLPARLRPLAGAQLLSSLGSAMTALAITYLAYSGSGSIVQTVVISAAYILPSVILGIPAGRLADRRLPVRVLVVLNALKAMLYLALALLGAAGALDPAVLLVFAVANGSLSALVYPSWRAYMHGLVPGERLDELNATWSSLVSVGAILGAALGGLFINTAGPTPVFLLNALTFLPLDIAILRTPSRLPDRRDRPRTSAREILGEILEEPVVLRAMIGMAMLSLLLAPISQLLPAIAAQVGSGPHVLGALTAVVSLGSATVAWGLGRLKRRLSTGPLLRWTFLLASACLILLGAARLLDQTRWLILPVVAALFALGLMLAMAKSVLTAIVQIHASPEMEGGVIAVLAAVFAVGSSMGALVLAFGAERTDIFTVLGLAGLLLGLYVLGQRWLGSPRATVSVGEAPPPG